MDLMNVMSLLLCTQQVTLGKETSSNSIRLDLSDVAWLCNVETLPLAWVLFHAGLRVGDWLLAQVIKPPRQYCGAFGWEMNNQGHWTYLVVCIWSSCSFLLQLQPPAFS